MCKIALYAVITWISTCGTSVEAAPVEAYGRLPTIEHVTISPDGNKLAFIQDVAGKRTAIVYDFTSKTLIADLIIGDAKARTLSWAGDRYLLLTTSVTAQPMYISGPRREWYMALSLDIEKHQVTRLQPNEERTMNVVMRPPVARIVNGRPTAIVEGVHFKDGQSALLLFAQDLESGRKRILEQASSDARRWVVDNDGVAVGEADYREYSRHWSLKVKRGQLWHETYTEDAPIDVPSLEGFSADGTSLIVHTAENEEGEFKSLNLESGTFGPPWKSGLGLEHVIIDQNTDRIIGGTRLTDKIEYIFFAPEDQEKWNKALALFPNADVKLESWSADHNKIIVHVSGPLDGDTYRMVDLASGSTVVVGQAYADIAAADVARVSAITYAAADGFRIPAYMTLPNGRPPKDLPLIVLPHGGPAARDIPGFDWWSQALASRGYAVLQPQFRGSGGWDKRLLFAGFGEWGRKMQTDLSDGVRDLVAKGIVDPKRVCIVGGSYGGYAALAGAAFDAGVYRCAVSVAGISDIREFLDWVKLKSTDLSIRYWDRFLGASNSRDPVIDAVSPAKHIENINIPILLIHGRDDTVVPIRQSEIIADALKHAGKPVEFVELKGEDHWLSRSETRLQMLQATVDFLQKNNPAN